MPCYTITTVNVDLGKVDVNLLELALKDMGFVTLRNKETGTLFFNGMSYNQQSGQMVLSQSAISSYGSVEDFKAKVKQHYSKQVVLGQAKRHGWTVKETAPFQYAISKR